MRVFILLCVLFSLSCQALELEQVASIQLEHASLAKPVIANNLIITGDE